MAYYRPLGDDSDVSEEETFNKMAGILKRIRPGQTGESSYLLVEKNISGESSDNKDDEIPHSDDTTPPGNSREDEIERENAATVAGYRTAIQRALGLLFAFLYGTTLSASFATAQVMSSALPNAELNALRFLSIQLFATPFLCQERCKLMPSRRRDFLWIGIISVIYTAKIYIEFTTAHYLPLGTIAAVLYGTEIITNWTISILIYRDPQVGLTISIFLAIAGTVLVVQPHFLFGELQTGLSSNETAFSCFTPCEDDVTGNMTSLVNSNTGEALWGGGHDGIGYAMVISTAVLTAIKDNLIHKKISHVRVGVYSFWMPLLAVCLSLIVMLATEQPTWPTCWLCSVIAVLHLFSVAWGRILTLLMLKRLLPLLVAIVATCTTTTLNFILQYTLLASIQPGHNNWQEYLGAALVISALIVGPALQIWLYYRREQRKKAELMGISDEQNDAVQRTDAEDETKPPAE